ncbi:MAG: HAD family hydrolase [Bacillota bacterium]|nr:HAD family hydrolase [Bacillota bacterium]
MAYKWIFFDCMETLIDLTELPGLRDYAMWAYEGSGVENIWKDFNEFFSVYLSVREKIQNGLPENKEYGMYERFEAITSVSNPSFTEKQLQKISLMLYRNYWNNYKKRSYVKEDVNEVLPRLYERFKLAVVSNFMVQGGIEELLKLNGISRYFEFVVTSINEGWRKPEEKIYTAALNKACITPGNIIFAGDDYINDYVTPARIGMNTILLDRYKKHEDLDSRVMNFYELESKLELL